MELKEFIKTVIADITGAVKELQSELGNGAIVNPSLPSPISNGTVVDEGNPNINRRISTIDFDIAITVGDVSSVEGDAKGGIMIFSASVNGEKTAHSENVSKLTFSVPVVLPTEHVKSMAEINKDRFYGSRTSSK